MAVGTMAHGNEDIDLASSLSHAIQLRASYLRGQASSLTLPSLRRMLEKDLGLKNLELDAHKTLVTDLVDKVLNDGEDAGNDSGKDGENETAVAQKSRKRRKNSFRVEEDLQDSDGDGDGEEGLNDDVSNQKQQKLRKTPEDDEEEKSSEEPDNSSENAGEKEEEDEDLGDKNVAVEDVVEEEEDKELSENEVDEPSGAANAIEEEVSDGEADALDNVLASTEEALDEGTHLPQDEHRQSDDQESSEPHAGDIDESTIKAALLKRADDLKSRAESLTLTGVRQMLAEDLGVDLSGLAAHKQFIRKLVDELLEGSDDEPIAPPRKAVKKEATISTRDGKPKKKKADKPPLGKKSKQIEEPEESEEKEQRNGEASDSSSEERRPGKATVRKKKSSEAKTKAMQTKKIVEVKKPFSAKVERLREILKTVGIGVSPIVYKKAKEAPEHERDEVLVRELENKLIQEGLSANPTEKEIKKVKARLQKKKDLEGIEHSNIVMEPRRRTSANNWFAPRANKYLHDAGEEDSDDEPKPIVTGAMDD